MNQRRPSNKYFTYKDAGDERPLVNLWESAKTFENVNSVTVYFCDFRENFIALMNNLSHGGKRKLTVVGCVAWFSDPQIVECLAACCQSIFFLVNDEDFSVWGNGKTPLLYDQLPWSEVPINTLFQHLNDVFAPLTGQYAPVRCVKSGDGARGRFLMHNKYVIFLQTDSHGLLQCTGVWLGSVNFTKNASNNLESAFYVEDERVATSVFHDFSNLFSISSPITTTTTSRVSGKFTYCKEKQRWIYEG